jgi:hypothetical protein
MSSHHDSFVCSGSSPTSNNGPDFRCESDGSLFLLFPLNQSAHSWIEEYCPSDAEWHRYSAALVAGIELDGLVVRR